MAYNFPPGLITMAEVVRYANEHGMYFSDNSFPRLSSVKRASGVMTYASSILKCEATIPGMSEVQQWRDNAKTINYVLVMTVSGLLLPASLASTPVRVVLAMEHGAEWSSTIWERHTHPNSATQNDPAGNYRGNIHALYTISACGSRVATDATPFVGRATFDNTSFNLDLVYSHLDVELSLFDVVDDTVGLS
jgi:hypothetical protein